MMGLAGIDWREDASADGPVRWYGCKVCGAATMAPCTARGFAAAAAFIDEHGASCNTKRFRAAWAAFIATARGAFLDDFAALRRYFVRL